MMLCNNLPLKFHYFNRRGLSSHPFQKFNFAFSAQESALAQPVSNYSETVPFITANRWSSLLLLPEAKQASGRQVNNFRSRLSTQTPDMTAYTLEPPTLCLHMCINVQGCLHSVSAIAFCPIHRKIKKESHTWREQEWGRPLFTLDAVQVSSAPTKQSLREPNYTACVPRSLKQNRNLVLVRQFWEVLQVAVVPCII